MTEENLPDVRPEQVVMVSPEPVATMFEGEMITAMRGKVPVIDLDMEVGYPRNTHLKIEIEVRVQNVSVIEGRKGELIRHHQFSLEETRLVGAYTAAQLDPGTGGDLSQPDPPEDEPDDQADDQAAEAQTDSDTRPKEEVPDVGF